MINKTVTIREDQEDWVRKKNLNLSGFIRDKIDEEIQIDNMLEKIRKASDIQASQEASP